MRAKTQSSPAAVDFDRLRDAVAARDQSRFRAELLAQAEPLQLYLRGFAVDGAPSALAHDYVNDAHLRFVHTLGLIPLTPPPARILEIGSNPYYFHLLLHKIFPQAEIEGANFFDKNIFSTDQAETVQTTRNATTGEVYSYRSKLFNIETLARYPYPEGSFDLAFFCETLEHLVVNPLATFRKLKRVLRPGGHLVITLPNAVRLTNFALMLHGHNLFDVYQPQNGVHGRHNREFTLAEMQALLAGDGFEVVRAETHDRYDYERSGVFTMDYTGRTLALPAKGSALRALLKRAGGTTEHRGDNLYLLARKPATARPRAARAAATGREKDGPLPTTALGRSEPERADIQIDVCDDGPTELRVEGWLWRRHEEDARRTVHLVLRTAETAYAFETESVFREDVADERGLSHEDVGFRRAIDKRALPAGRYALGVWVHGGEAAPLFALVGREIDVAG